jgi:hypothetical protein
MGSLGIVGLETTCFVKRTYVETRFYVLPELMAIPTSSHMHSTNHNHNVFPGYFYYPSILTPSYTSFNIFKFLLVSRLKNYSVWIRHWMISRLRDKRNIVEKGEATCKKCARRRVLTVGNLDRTSFKKAKLYVLSCCCCCCQTFVFALALAQNYHSTRPLSSSRGLVPCIRHVIRRSTAIERSFTRSEPRNRNV